MTIGESWNVARPVNLKLCISTQLLHHNKLKQRPDYWGEGFSMLIHLPLPSLVNKTPRKLLHLRKRPRGCFTTHPFWDHPLLLNKNVPQWMTDDWVPDAVDALYNSLTELAEQSDVLSYSVCTKLTDFSTQVRAKETLVCVKGMSRRAAGTKSHRTQGHHCQDLGNELQSCYCWLKRNPRVDKRQRYFLPFGHQN